MNEYDPEFWKEPCPKVQCKKKCACGGLQYVNIPAALTTKIIPGKGLYCNAIVEYEGTGEVYIYSQEGIPVKVKEADGS